SIKKKSGCATQKTLANNLTGKQFSMPPLKKLTLTKYLEAVILGDLAIPSNIKYGTNIFKRGGVQVINEQKTKVEAWAGGLSGSVLEGGGGKRRVQLWLKNKKLHWHC